MCIYEMPRKMKNKNEMEWGGKKRKCVCDKTKKNKNNDDDEKKKQQVENETHTYDGLHARQHSSTWLTRSSSFHCKRWICTYFVSFFLFCLELCFTHTPSAVPRVCVCVSLHFDGFYRRLLPHFCIPQKNVSSVFRSCSASKQANDRTNKREICTLAMCKSNAIIEVEEDFYAYTKSINLRLCSAFATFRAETFRNTSVKRVVTLDNFKCFCHLNVANTFVYVMLLLWDANVLTLVLFWWNLDENKRKRDREKENGYHAKYFAKLYWVSVPFIARVSVALVCRCK